MLRYMYTVWLVSFSLPQELEKLLFTARIFNHLRKNVIYARRQYQTYQNLSFSLLPCNVASFVPREFPLRSKSFEQQLIRRLGRNQSHSGHCKEENISCSFQNRANICLYSSLYTKRYKMNDQSSSDRPISEEIQINIKF
jgi:hypothetical protein